MGGLVPCCYSTSEGGGGGGGRITLQYHNTTFTGKLSAQGGRGIDESGGAGTIINQDLLLNENRLHVDNSFIGGPKELQINYPGLIGVHRGRDSCRTWLLPPGDASEYDLEEVSINGGSHLALFKATASDTQSVVVESNSGDNSGYFHVGPLQVGVF